MFRTRKCYCMNNSYQNDSCQMQDDMIEEQCNNINSYEDLKNDCECGFDDEERDVFPGNPMLAQSYVPYQYMDKTFKPCVGLDNGTIFPELISPYCPGDSMKQIEFLRKTNSIGEGCNANGGR